MSSKHKYFLDLIGSCINSQIVDLDTRIPGTRMNLRQVILSIRDKNDSHRVFNSIDVQWNEPQNYVLTFRPDKRNLAYAFNNSLSTYAHHVYPEVDFSKIFIIEANDKALEETYHPDLQQFTTQEDIALQKEMKTDRDDDSLDYIPEDELPSYDDDLDEAPVKEITNTRIFNLSGETDTVSTIANDNASVSFNDEVSYHEAPPIVSTTTNDVERPDDTTENSNHSGDSINTRIT